MIVGVDSLCDYGFKRLKVGAINPEEPSNIGNVGREGKQIIIT